MVAGVAGLLLAAVAGYWALERASQQRGRVKQVGEWVGGLVIVLSFVALIALALCQFYCPMTKGKGWCPPGGMSGMSGMMCPVTGKTTDLKSGAQ